MKLLLFSLVTICLCSLPASGQRTGPGSAPISYGVVVPTSDTICASAGDSISGLTCNNASVAGTTETAFTTILSLPANYLATAGKVVRITMTFGLWSSFSSPTINLRFRWGGTGGTALFTSGAVAGTSSKTNLSFTAVCIVGVQANAGASVASVTGCNISLPGWTAASGSGNTTTQPQNIATNAAGTLGVTITYSAATAGNALKLLSFVPEIIN